FSQFTSHLALIREACESHGIGCLYLDGQTTPKQRQKLVEGFQNGDGDAFLISLKAGGTGLNLTAADYVIHMDPWWNPAVEDQATDRAHRIGQTKNVMVYRLIARGTIEEEILKLHSEKRDLVDGILAGTEASAAMSTEELARLIRGDN
ncbi:MAG: SWF/SNF helicase family protein, partial [Planctomycetaceae bacterium]|nr:SWF/SNF helicase family protein [Planctomycetaceae bacterium]